MNPLYLGLAKFCTDTVVLPLISEPNLKLAPFRLTLFGVALKLVLIAKLLNKGLFLRSATAIPNPSKTLFKLVSERFIAPDTLGLASSEFVSY